MARDEQLQDPNTGKPDESPSTLTVTPVLGGRFVRLDYTWVYGEKPQEGSLLVGFDGPSQAVSRYWIDAWHMGSKAMKCGGTGERGWGVRPRYVRRAAGAGLGLADRRGTRRRRPPRRDVQRFPGRGRREGGIGGGGELRSRVKRDGQAICDGKLRREELNLLPPGYEPGELPVLHSA